MKIEKYILIILIFTSLLNAQYQMYFVTNSNTPQATAYNNSHKVALQDPFSDTVNVVFQSADSVYFVFSHDQGQSWSPPAAIQKGKYPGIDVDHFGFRHLVWQSLDTILNTYEIYYDCIDEWNPPMNISQSPGHSELPDLVVDANGVVHIVWAENVAGYTQVYYRTVWQNVLGDTVQISGVGSNQANYNHPSISMFPPNYRIYAVWDCYDPACYSPYQIHLRYKEDTLWSTTTTWAHYLTMCHPSFDYSHGLDELSFCYEDSTSGNMEATFQGGNGGGYSTTGHSTYPGVSTVGSTWSYLFWQEDSAGYEDIYGHFFYSMSGWTQLSLREYFNIQEPVKYPSTTDAYLVWTQGDNPPYSIYLAYFDYPIGVKEGYQLTVQDMAATPNPFSRKTRITYEIPETESRTSDRIPRLEIYDSVGQLVQELYPSIRGRRLSVEWSGRDNTGRELPNGVYFCEIEGFLENRPLKIVKLD